MKSPASCDISATPQPLEISVLVAATPIAQPRQRHGARVTADGDAQSFNYLDTKHPIHAYKHAIQEAVRTTMAGRPPLTGPLHLGVSFVLPRRQHPKRHGINRIPNAKHVGDVDNFLKAVFDACNGLLFDDDCQVTSCFATKEEAAQGESPHVLVLAQTIAWSPQMPAKEDAHGQEREGEYSPPEDGV